MAETVSSRAKAWVLLSPDGKVALLPVPPLAGEVTPLGLASDGTLCGTVLDGDALEFTTAYLNARLAKPQHVEVPAVDEKASKPDAADVAAEKSHPGQNGSEKAASAKDSAKKGSASPAAPAGSAEDADEAGKASGDEPAEAATGS